MLTLTYYEHNIAKYGIVAYNKNFQQKHFKQEDFLIPYAENTITATSSNLCFTENSLKELIFLPC